MHATKALFLAISLIGCSALAQEQRSEIMSRQSDFDPVVANQIAELQNQIEQLQKQHAESQAKYQKDLLRLQQLQAAQEQQRQNELRKKQSEDEAERQKQRNEADRSLWPLSQPGVVALTAVGGENGEPAHYVAQPGAAPENDKEAQQKAEFSKAVEQSKAEVLRIYPDAGVDESPLRKKIIEIADRMEAQGNPLVHQADAPLKVAQMAANELGIPPKP
jgi:hypothetical protein